MQLLRIHVFEDFFVNLVGFKSIVVNIVLVLVESDKNLFLCTSKMLGRNESCGIKYLGEGFNTSTVLVLLEYSV